MSAEGRATLVGWLRDRVGWEDVRARLALHRAPHRSFFFYVGGLTLFLLLVQVLSGVLLLLYYRPDVAQAHASVERVVTEVPYGDLVRGVHAWAGDLFVASLFAHAFAVVVRRTFRAPHELGWLTGIVAAFLGVGIAFTGAILPWSATAYTHARVGSELARQVPFVGAWLRTLLRGGDDVGASTLARAFGFHVALLPAALTATLAAHLFLVSRRPIVPASKHDDATIPLYPDFMVRQAVALVGLLVVVMTLAIFVHRSFGVPVDVRAPTPADARPPWYFLPVHEIVRIAPRQLLGVDGARFLVGAACGVLALGAALPLLDPRGSKVTAWVAWGLLLVVLILGARGLA